MSYCQSGWLPPYILVGKFVWEVGLSIQTSGGWRHGVPFFWEHPGLDFWYVKRCSDFSSKSMQVGNAGDGFQFPPPHGGT